LATLVHKEFCLFVIMAVNVDIDGVLGIPNAGTMYSLGNLIEGRYIDQIYEYNEPLFLNASPYYENDQFNSLLASKHGAVKNT